MTETYLSFYLRYNRIHIFVDALRGIGCPKYICFMIQTDGNSLAVIPYDKKGFLSHRIPADDYDGVIGMEVCSMKLCQIISSLHRWDADCSYRVPGIVYEDQKAVIFDLLQAEIIKSRAS